VDEPITAKLSIALFLISGIIVLGVLVFPQLTAGLLASVP
jgi:hypothetical protein